MQLTVALFVLLTVAQAEDKISIDWSKVKPINELRHRKNHGQINKPHVSNRLVVGGNNATKNQFPYQVGLSISINGIEGIGFCGGSLISSNRVLTAAHCLENVSSLIVILGAHMIFNNESNKVQINVLKSELFPHPEYDNKNGINDIGIIKLQSEVTFNDMIKPIELAEGDNDFANETAVISGWGSFDSKGQLSPVLKFASLKVITNNECLNDYEDIDERIICTNGAGNVGGCHGDSGGPLTVEINGKNVLAGVVSFGSDKGCETGQPTAYTRVSSFIPWIKSNLK